METSSKRNVAMHWFRKGLRLHDNPSLLKALDIGAAVYPVYVLDGDCYQLRHCSVLRAKFLLECLEDLNLQLKAAGSRLYVVKGDPASVLPELWGEFSVTDLCFEADETGEPYGAERDRAIQALAKSSGVRVHTFSSETLHPLSEYARECSCGIGRSNLEAIPDNMTAFQKLFRQMGPPNQPLHAPKLFPNNCDPEEMKDRYRTPSCPTGIPWPRNLHRGGVTPIWDRSDCNKEITPMVPGGESAALERLKQATEDPLRIATFEKPQTSYISTTAPSTLCISPYMSLGCLSPRTVWWTISCTIDRAPSSVRRSQPPVSLHGQLLWRDFNNLVAHACNLYLPASWGSAHCMPDRFCRKIAWTHNAAYLQAWRTARTGFPWIDACLTQLHATGWIHHLGRHAVACFLTRGDLWQSWEFGALHFESHLLDADYSLNVFDWLWLSCSGFYHKFFRCYSPVTFAKKQDPSGAYIRKWIPLLRKLPDEFIYEPWKAPLSVQKAAGFRIGQDYPKPIVDHKVVSKDNMGKLAVAYSRHKQESNEGGNKSSKKKILTSDNAANKRAKH